jgi:multiple sugar transport system substrate-binding protein
VQNVGGGSDEYTKIRSALKAGKGAPDVAQIEYQYLPSFRLTNSLENLDKYGADELSDEYVDWIWNQVSDDEGVWAVPQDSGPMGLLYRSDIMRAAGITSPPTTWDDFAEIAAAVRERTGSYITDIPPNDPSQMEGLLWQGGAKPFGYDGKETVKVDINSPEAQKVVSYWNDLLQKDLVGNEPHMTNDWYQAVNAGKYASWLAPAWAPLFLSQQAEPTTGKWRVAPMPQWDAGEQVTGNWGGSTNAVLSTSEHKIAAYELAKFINNDQASTLQLATEQFLFPTLESTLNDPTFVEQTSEFYGGQKVNKSFTEISGTVDVDFQWLPFMDFVNSSYSETLGSAIANRTDLKAGLAAWQDEVVAYAEEQGFKVTQ